MHAFRWMSSLGSAVLCLVAALAFAMPAQAQIAELKAQKIRLSIDRSDIAVSGISSGAAMAHQLHIARSSSLSGVGMVAGPPFRCADYFLGDTSVVLTNTLVASSPAIQTAIALCTAYYKKMGEVASYLDGIAATPIDPARLQGLIRDAADRNRIDPLKGVCQDRVFLIAGADDDTVPRKITDATEGLYRWLLSQCGDEAYVKANLHAETRPGMPHTMPTNSTAEMAHCAAGAPYIADCDYAGADALLAFLHPKHAGTPANRPADLKNLIKFDQGQVIGPFEPKGLMHRNGYIYVPESCKAGQSCALHIALHGCHQNEDQINEGLQNPPKTYLFPVDAGYNDYAEKHGIVVLYPQVANTDMTGSNPSGCWDWWGYNGVGYYQKDGMQIRNIWKIVEAALRK